MNSVLVFAPIALREIEFYLAVIEELKQVQPDLKYCFVSFVQQGNDQVRKAGHKVYDLYKYVARESATLEERFMLERKYGIKDIVETSLHEAVNFGITSKDRLALKFVKYLKAHESIFSDIRKDFPNSKIIGVQELGGFVAPLSFFYVCRRNKFEHKFFEPSFFRGRINILTDTLDPAAVREYPKTISEKVRSYLSETILRKHISIPAKDIHHFKDMGISKIFNRRNLNRLSEKLYSKYIKGHTQEYEHIWFHTSRYMKMYWNRKRMDSLYTRVEALGGQRVVYFPFHVQLDFALTVRTPRLFDQLSVVKQIADNLPKDVVLVAKEHPASIGGFPFEQVSELLKSTPNLKILHPTSNTFDVLNRVKAVVTINSKAGAESLVMGLPVIVMGPCFYSESDLVVKSTLESLPQALEKVLSKSYKEATEEKRLQFFTEVWNASYDGELYNLNRENVSKFSQSLTQSLKSASRVQAKNIPAEASL